LQKHQKTTITRILAAFLDEDKARRDFLLGFLVQYHQNVVNNLTTKNKSFYAEVTQSLWTSLQKSLAPLIPPSKQLPRKAKRTRKPRRPIRRMISRTAPGAQNIALANLQDILGMTVIA
jgi:hypothetical protein